MAGVAKASRSSEQHVQQELLRRGGKRKGAGRKPANGRAGSSHEARPFVDAKHPLHVVLRVVPEVGNLRRRRMYKAVRDASVVAAVRGRIRIAQISIQDLHLHLIIEAENNEVLARGMQGLQISLARNINSALSPDGIRRRRGRVFAGRYYLVVLRSPTQVRNALTYVLQNWRKHHEDQSRRRAPDCIVDRGAPATWLVDPYSSGLSFPDWQEREGEDWMWPIPDGYDPLVVFRPRSWLLSEGWKLVGSISARTVPSKRD